MCRSKRINEVYEEEEEQGQHDDEFDRGFLGSISIHELESQGDPLKVKLKIINILTTFKLDIGADVTVIPESLFIKTGAKLKATKAKLTNQGQYKLHVLGVIDAKLTAGHGRDTTQQVSQSVWWPVLGNQIEELIVNCSTCRQHEHNRAEPLLPSELPIYPWQKVATDLLEYKKGQYLVVVDYYSRYAELAKLNSVTSADIILHLKSIFARHGIPEYLVSDNGPQYASKAFSAFSQEYGFHHITSIPYYAQANGLAEL